MKNDSLSDTQQEKKMSVKELHFEGQAYDMNICIEADKIVISMQEEQFELDRNQAHMVMLYFQEHLGYVSISKERLDEGTHE